MIIESPTLRRRSLVLAAAASALGACASSSRKLADRPDVRSIAVVSVRPPSWYTLGNDNAARLLVPFASLALANDSKTKARVLNERLAQATSSLGRDLTERAAADLSERGFEVERVENPAETENGDEFDYSRLSFRSDALLHLSFKEVGLYSPMTEPTYLPRVNVRAILVWRDRSRYLYDEDLYYGVDARTGKSWAIVAENPITFETFDDVLARLDDVRASFQKGALAISRRMSEQVAIALRG
jgi:hypothetical protein